VARRKKRESSRRRICGLLNSFGNGLFPPGPFLLRPPRWCYWLLRSSITARSEHDRMEWVHPTTKAGFLGPYFLPVRGAKRAL
jgi:hypothetical protein